MSARLIEAAGFDFAFMSGFTTSASRLGFPDTGLISYAEMLDQGRSIHEATSQLPVIGDGDTGYGNAMNVKRTVSGYASAGFAGILIEDQVWPKSCGHVKGKMVIDRAESVARIRAACDARDEGQDIIIVARTDARQAISFEEALWRAAAFADAGADVIFIDALPTEREMVDFCRTVKGGYKMANMLEGGGKTPILPPARLQDIGFKLCAYPLTLLGVSVTAMQRALEQLRSGQISRDVPSFSELQHIIGFDTYFEQEATYAVRPVLEKYGSKAVVEADTILEPDGGYEAENKREEALEATIDADEEGSYKDTSSSRRATWLRLRIIERSSGKVTLETRFPAGFLEQLPSFIPALMGVDLAVYAQGKGVSNEPFFELDADDDSIQIFYENEV